MKDKIPCEFTMAFNGDGLVLEEGRARIPTVIAAEGIYEHEGLGKDGYRNAEESRKMIPYCNGLRLVEKHPGDDIYQFIGADMKDPDFPVFGYTENAHESPEKGPNGEVRIACDVVIDMVDRAGNDRMPLINGIKNRDITEVSITYFMNIVEQSGNFAGRSYDFLETNVNPYALGVMTDGWKAKCGEDTCGFNQAGKKGDMNMSGNESPPQPGGQGNENPPADTFLARINGMCPDKLAEYNGAVRKRFEEGENAVKKAKDLEAKLEEANKKIEEWDKDREELENFRAEKKKAEEEMIAEAVGKMKERIGEEAFKERYGEPEEGGPTYEQLESDWKLLDSIKPEEPPEAPEGEETPEEPAPGQGESGKKEPFWIGAAGKGVTMDKEEEWPEAEDVDVVPPKTFK